MKIEDHDIVITQDEVRRLWSKAFEAEYPPDIDVRKALEAVISVYGAEGLQEQL